MRNSIKHQADRPSQFPTNNPTKEDRMNALHNNGKIQSLKLENQIPCKINWESNLRKNSENQMPKALGDLLEVNWKVGNTSFRKNEEIMDEEEKLELVNIKRRSENARLSLLAGIESIGKAIRILGQSGETGEERELLADLGELVEDLSGLLSQVDYHHDNADHSLERRFIYEIMNGAKEGSTI